ncbi:MAG: inositol monophosphatase family protein [Candidatus Methanomethylicaceae archaeon]
MSLELIEGLCRAEVEAISKISPQSFSKVVKVGAGGDRTRLIDMIAEEAALSYLESIRFEGCVLSEEIGKKRFGSKELPILILDPIDGTTNAVRGIIPYSISAALSSGRKLSDIYCGMVMELPSKRTYKAVKGKGAYLDGRHIRLNHPPPLRYALIGMPMNVRGERRKLEELFSLCLAVKHIRNMGSASLELCYVASGGLDLYIDNRELLRITDIAASYLILKEARASVMRLDGSDLDSPLDLSERISLVAGHHNLCIEALSKLKTLTG